MHWKEDTPTLASRGATDVAWVIYRALMASSPLACVEEPGDGPGVIDGSFDLTDVAKLLMRECGDDRF